MNNFYALPNHNVAEDGKEGEDGGEGGLAVYHKEGDMVDFEAVGEIADSRATLVGMGYDDDFVTAVDKFGGELVDVRFDAAGLGKEEVRDHSDVVGHSGGLGGIVATRYPEQNSVKCQIHLLSLTSGYEVNVLLGGCYVRKRRPQAR